MHHRSRPPNRSDGSTAVTTAQGSGGDPPPAGATGASAQNSRSGNSGERSSGHPSSTGGGAGEPDSPSWCRPKPTSPHDSLGVFQTRSIFPRRASSGYFSSDCDSLPSSPLSPRPLMADSATQTPSPTGQMMQHALYRMAEAHGGGPGMHQQHGPSPSPSSMRPQHAAGDMQTEAIGRELRRIGDEFNGMLLLRGVAGGHRRVVILPNPLPHIHQEPAMLLCVGLLLLLIGRIMYLQGSTNQDHSQV